VELLHMSLMPANIGATVFLAMILAYWLTVLLGALDLDFLDFDLDADVDADLGSDLDVSVGVFDGMLAFFYLGKIPLMILLSIFALCLWVISIIANGYLNPSGSLALGLPLAVGNLIVSPFICKVICAPLARFFMALKKDPNAPADVMGRICRVTTSQVSAKMGQAEVSTSGAPILLNVVADGDHVFKKGDEAVVIGKDEKKGVHIIAPVNLED
jgi:hypothetical protein